MGTARWLSWNLADQFEFDGEMLGFQQTLRTTRLVHLLALTASMLLCRVLICICRFLELNVVIEVIELEFGRPVWVWWDFNKLCARRSNLSLLVCNSSCQMHTQTSLTEPDQVPDREQHRSAQCLTETTTRTNHSRKRTKIKPILTDLHGSSLSRWRQFLGKETVLDQNSAFYDYFGVKLCFYSEGRKIVVFCKYMYELIEVVDWHFHECLRAFVTKCC